MSARLSLVALLLVAAVAGCGSSRPSRSSSSSSSHPSAATAPNPNAPEKSPPGDIPDTQVYVTYTPPGGGYTLKVPEGWARSGTADPVTFTANLSSVRVALVPAKGPPTPASVEATDVPQLMRSTKGFKEQAVSLVRRPAGTAVRISYLASSTPDPVTGRVTRDAVERYVFFHRGRDLVLTLTAPDGSDNVDPWKLISSSVRWR
jgi:hypothetical protein